MFALPILRPLLVRSFAWWPLVLLLTAHAALAQRGRHYALDAPGERPVALLTQGRATYLVTTHSVLERRGRRFVRRCQSPSPIQCALLTDSLLWLGTAGGLASVTGPAWQLRPAPGPEPVLRAPITTLLRDARGQLWLGAAGYGAYALTAAGWQAQLSVPALNAGAATADSALWLGTSIGLYRWQHQQWTRYNEEGVANHEIPDNIVERLLPDHGGNLWVLMSAGISVLPTAGHGAEAHVPTVRYLGQPGTELYGLTYLPGQGHLLATSLGLLLLPAQGDGELAGFEAPKDRVETPQVLVPLALPDLQAAPQLLLPDAAQRLWVIGPNEVSRWRMGALRRVCRAAQRPAGRVVARR